MEIYMKSIPASTPDTKLKLELANILHALPFRNPTDSLFNFDIYLFKQRKRGPWRTGALTLPSNTIASRFLQLYGGSSPHHFLIIDTTRVQFLTSNRPVRPEVLERIRRTPFQDPREAHAREQMEAELRALQVDVSTIQFGCECRDQVYSVEWEKACRANLLFDGERREFRIRVDQGGLFSDTRIIAIRANIVYHVAATEDDASRQPVIFFSLIHPPAFESESTISVLASVLSSSPNAPTRQRWSSFDDGDDHVHIAPYISLAIRLECRSTEDLRTFRKFADAAHVRVYNDTYPVERRGVFSPATCEEYTLWIRGLPWTVVFQIEALLRSWLVNMTEALSLRSDIERVLKARGPAYTAALLRDFASHAKALYWYGAEQPGADVTFQTQLEVAWSAPVTYLFALVEKAFVYKPVDPPLSTADAPSVFQCLHVTITPTTMILEGPFPERSNRVMRTYFRNQECFLRVSFQDENRLQYRFDREVDGQSFINRRVRSVLRDGITIAGAHFRFLAYSQSALKEHAVWFVKPFRHRDEHGNQHLVDATTIIESLGNFRVSFDPTLIRCPARYAARISQAFTATDASITVDVGQLEAEADIKDVSGKYCFTDGVGTISTQLAKDIWRALRERGRRGRQDRTHPRAYQVRLQGSKGMLSVDYTLTGQVIVLRPSMIKFEAPQSLTVEIARAFDRPGPYFLNRPLIMLLEGLGVPFETFKDLQDEAVYEAQQSVTSLERSARLLEAHGLGVSFRLTSTMLGLHKLGLGPLDDVFWRQMMDFAVNHVLRELKHHARIPVPGRDSWTLVGVADVHKQLREGEVFACIDSPSESGLIYLEGPVLISRSPTIHPGDVQVVNAIGRPPAGSPLAKESLRNTVVFSILGERPLPSCLGGGDLDGDLYNVTTRRDLLPDRTYKGASYDPAPKKLVDHESTMEDVADFVAEYISSDTLGIIAITWLIIADQSPDGILDSDCITLAALHSDAVDYPKSGQPVPMAQIPKLKFRSKPDWNAPETIRADNADYYPSMRAIGKLFRLIDLPAIETVRRAGRSQRRRMRNDSQDDQYEDVLEQFYDDETHIDDAVVTAVQHRVSEFIRTDEYHDDFIRRIWELYNSYASQLRAICADHTLEHKRSAMLTEEEAVVGTIVAKCSQPRKRKDLMSQMREQTATLVSSVKGEIAGDDDVPSETSLERAWIAYRLASMEGDAFGARSFAWVALGSVFDAIKEIEDEERTLSRR